MSLLMQALKKAEQAKRSHAGEEDLVKPSEEFDDVLELAPQEEQPLNRRATDPVRLDVPNGIEPPDFSLEPIEPAAIHDAMAPELEVPSWNEAQPAAEIPDALHTAVPPAASVPPAEGRPTAQARRHAAHAEAARPARAEAPAAARQHGARTGPPPPPPPPPSGPVMAAPLRIPNARTMRLAALLGVLLLIAATFGYLYWRAVYGSGSSKNLPPVPMPGLAGGAAAPVQPQGSVIVVPPGGTQAPGYEAQTYIPPADTTMPAQQVDAMPVQQPAYPAAQPAPAPSAVATTFPSNIGAAPTPQATAAQPPMQTAPPAPVATPAQNVPSIPAEQMQNLSPEEYARMDRQAAEAADARAASANSQPMASGVTVTPSPVPAPATLATTSAPAAHPAPGMPPTTSGEAPVQVRQRTSSGEVNPALQSAWVAFRQGDIATAREQYGALLQAEPRNRDALLGSAAISLRDRQPERAAEIYTRLLEADPNDADALAGLVAIRQTDPVQTEARLRRIINLNPEAASALSALGGLYARQGRWSEAQQQYFKAFAVLPQNADYAFNLAVALDRINQPKLAATYYQRALALAAGGATGFDTNAVATRLRELGAR